MKCGFTQAEVLEYWHNLSTQVFDYWGHDHTPPEFMFYSGYKEVYAPPGTIAFASWREDVYERLSVPKASARWVAFDTDYIPYLFEDELIGTLIHEAAHVVAGLHAGHDRYWQQASRELGGHDDAYLVMRNWRETLTGAEAPVPKWTPVYYQLQTPLPGYTAYV